MQQREISAHRGPRPVGAFWRAWLGACAVVLVSSPGSALAVTRFALIAGHNTGAATDPRLRWAEEDARRMRDVLRDLSGVAAERIDLLVGENVEALLLAVARLSGEVEEAHRRGERTEVFFYFSGHGDAEALRLGRERLALSKLDAALATIPADVVVTVLDACRSGVRAGQPKGAVHGPAFDVTFTRQVGPSGRVLITSASDDEIAQESDDLMGGFFTHHVVAGLRGAADRDRDERVTLAELYAYAYHHTVRGSFGRTAAVQHPEMNLDLEGEGDLTVSTLSRSTSQLILGASLAGDMLVVDEASGRVEVELHKASGQALAVALPAGRFVIQRRHEGRIFVGGARLEWGGKHAVEAVDLEEREVMMAAARGLSVEALHPWRLHAGVAMSGATGLDGAALWGGALGVDYGPWELPIFLGMRAILAAGAEEGVEWDFEQTEWSMALGVGGAGRLGPLRVAALVGGGVAEARQQAARHDAERIQAISAVPVARAGTSLGPLALLEGSLALRLFAGAFVFGAAGGQVVWLEVGGSRAAELHARVSFGAGYEL